MVLLSAPYAPSAPTAPATAPAQALAPAATPARVHRAATRDAAREVPRHFLLATTVLQPDHGLAWPPHRHVEHELLWTDSGVAHMVVDGRQWTVTPGVGVWIPAGVEHEGSTRDRTAVRATYFALDSWTKTWPMTTAVRIHPAVRQLLMHLKHAAMSDVQRLRAQQVCMDMLEATESVQLDVPLPQDARLAPLAARVIADPADDRSLEQWASDINLTARTVSRIFAAEVAMSFAAWRRLVRMQAALGALAGGVPVKTVAGQVGYRTTSAFVAAFRKVVGSTPGDIAGRL